MNIKPVMVSLGLGTFSSLLAIALSQNLKLNPQIALAQAETSQQEETAQQDSSQADTASENAASCPLPEEIAITFLDAECKEVELLMPQTFFRYYSDDTNKKGRYLTTEQYRTNVAVISNLALNQSWGNKAEKMLSITLPAGTIVYQGTVAPQTPASCYPGGGQQTFIKDSRDPSLFWTEGPALDVEPFSCP